MFQLQATNSVLSNLHSVKLYMLNIVNMFHQVATGLATTIWNNMGNISIDLYSTAALLSC